MMVCAVVCVCSHRGDVYRLMFGCLYTQPVFRAQASETLAVVGADSHGHGMKRRRKYLGVKFISFLWPLAVEELCARNKSEHFTCIINSFTLPNNQS